MFFGLPALFAAMILPFSPLTALPWVIVLWSIAGLAGYKIWRIDHPANSARAALGVRVRWLVAGAVTCVIALVFRSDPVWLVAGLGLWLLALVALGLILHWLAKTERDLEARFPSPSPIDEPSPEITDSRGPAADAE